MTDYIKREDVLYQLNKQATIDGQPRAIRRATRIVAEFPSANVVERKKGKWKQGYCSECGYNWGKDAPIASVPNFCPNCGSDNRGRKDERTD